MSLWLWIYQSVSYQTLFRIKIPYCYSFPPVFSFSLFLNFYLHLLIILWHLSPAINFCFFSFSWDIFFFCATSSSGLRTTWFFFFFFFSGKDHLNVARRALVWVDLTMSSVSPELHLGDFVHLEVLNVQRIYI